MPQINHLHTQLASTGTWGVGVEERLERGARGKRDVVKGIKGRNMEGQTDLIRGKPVQFVKIKLIYKTVFSFTEHQR